jgi:serine/threonine protein phosphatase PrpC
VIFFNGIFLPMAALSNSSLTEVVGSFRTGRCEEIGLRPTLEDRTIATKLEVKGFPETCFFAVFDGHAGQAASIFLEKHLHQKLEATLQSVVYAAGSNGDDVIKGALIKCFVEADKELCSTDDGSAGSTAATCLVIGDRIFAANVGDSRVVLCRNGQVFKGASTFLRE